MFEELILKNDKNFSEISIEVINSTFFESTEIFE